MTAAVNAFCRSVNSSNSNNFCLVNTDGSANNSNANNSRALAPGFYRMGQKRTPGASRTRIKGEILPWVKLPKTAL